MISILDYGAKGDGKKDCTKAIQKAITEAAKRGGGTVLVPEGTYLSSTLRLAPQVGLKGNPTWDYRNFGGSIIKLINDPKAYCLLDITKAFGARISGICLDGGKLGEKVHGVLSQKAEYGPQEDTPFIENCRISHFTGDGIQLYKIWCFGIRHCMVSHNKGNGLSVCGWDGFILDNWFSGNGGAGYSAVEENASITMTGNRIEWNTGGGIFIYGGSHYNITGNYIDRSGGAGISFLPKGERTGKVISITGNVIYRSGKPEWTKADSYDSCHVRFEGVKGLVFTGNTMNVGRDDAGLSEFSPNFAIVYGSLTDSVIKDNVMFEGALRELTVDLGNNNNTVMKDNMGSLFVKPIGLKRP